jgi:hypothetical protein
MLVAAGLFSCKKFLDEQPEHSLIDANAITSAETAKAAVGGIYATFQNDSWAGALYVALATKSGFVNYTGQTDFELSYSTITPPANVVGIWTQFYKSLNAANFAIKGINSLPEAAITEQQKNALVAEARCLRAWIGANILWNYGHWWGDDSDPFGLLYREEPVDLSNVLQARLPVGESYQKLYEDLDFAIANLGDFATSRYVSKQFAKVLKAKLLLYRGGYKNNSTDLQASLALVNEVLNNHPAQFSMEEDMAKVYEQAWDSKEVLFARYLEDNGSRTSYGGYYYTYYLSQIGGNALPLPPGGTLTAGLKYGVDWYSADPRWSIVTGPVRAAETWDNTMHYTFKKLARLGSYAGKQSSDPNAEKYAAYYFRFPELYLMKAELLARTGASVSDAIAPINEMRAQRENPELPALNPGSQAELMDVIFKEIVMETFMENGSEFFAAVRFQHNGQPWIVTIKDGLALNVNKMCWPIPEPEITNNTLMEQNPE